MGHARSNPFPASHQSSDVQAYARRPLSQREGFRRLERSMEKLDAASKAREKVCDVCGRRCRAWRLVPSKDGARIGRTEASRSGGLTGKFVVACDKGPDGCAAMLDRAGVSKEAVALEERVKALGLVLP